MTIVADALARLAAAEDHLIHALQRAHPRNSLVRWRRGAVVIEGRVVGWLERGLRVRTANDREQHVPAKDIVGPGD